MKVLIERLAAALDTVLALGLLAMVVLACVNVALRYIWSFSLLWADEALVFSMVAVSFLGLIGVSARDQHLRMSMVLQWAGRRATFAVRLVEYLVTIVVCAFVGFQSWQVVSRLYARGTLSNMAEVPLWLVNGLVLVGLAGMALVALTRLVAALRHGQEVDE
ncbi:TRAP transporter small permease [Amorphus sp. 3PC139-8]|uniref:TRAP transporter small permease n=1 Tax=Amorphus sp. 3PC139-8 TaxID=2735676 RepID=UPI00345D65C2